MHWTLEETNIFLTHLLLLSTKGPISSYLIFLESSRVLPRVRHRHLFWNCTVVWEIKAKSHTILWHTQPLLGKGRGRQVIAVARTADVVIMMLDATKGDVQRCVTPPWPSLLAWLPCISSWWWFIFFLVFSSRELLEKELESVGIRLNRERPNIYFKVQFMFYY